MNGRAPPNSALDLDKLSPEAAMRALVTFTFDTFVGDRTFINLLSSENLHQARHLKESARVREMHSPLIGMIQTILDRGVEAGVFRGGIDPAQLWISIAGISYFYFSNIFTLSVILDRDLQGRSGDRDAPQPCRGSDPPIHQEIIAEPSETSPPNRKWSR